MPVPFLQQVSCDMNFLESPPQALPGTSQTQCFDCFFRTCGGIFLKPFAKRFQDNSGCPICSENNGCADISSYQRNSIQTVGHRQIVMEQAVPFGGLKHSVICIYHHTYIVQSFMYCNDTARDLATIQVEDAQTEKNRPWQDGYASLSMASSSSAVAASLALAPITELSDSDDAASQSEREELQLTKGKGSKRRFREGPTLKQRLQSRDICKQFVMKRCGGKCKKLCLKKFASGQKFQELLEWRKHWADLHKLDADRLVL